MPCASMEINFGLPTVSENMNPDMAYIKFYFKRTTKIKMTILDYGFVSMFAEIGGYTGLFLGVSVREIVAYLNTLGIKFIV